MHCDFEMDFREFSSVLVGRSLFYFLSDSARILEYDLARHGLNVFDPPDSQYYDERFNLMLAEDGGLGVSEALDPHLKLWSREASDGTDPRWVLSRIIKLGNFLPNDALVDATSFVYVLGFAEGANAIFVNTVAGLFMIDLQSERVMKVCDDRGLCNLIPVVSFYTPLSQSKHHVAPPSNPGEDAICKGRGGEDEETLEREQQLFDKGSNEIEEGDSVNACFSHAVETRVPSYVEVPLECPSTEYGCALVQKAQEVNDPLDDVPKSVPNEESVTGAANKADAGKSKTSDSDVEDATAPSRKGDTEEERAGWPE